MRWRVGVVLCLFAAYVAVGCRDPLTPNIDRNEAPETWITAAPFDTITIKDEFGRPVDAPLLPGQLPRSNTVPVRFHVYWAGSDKDGAVAGFYWAVVETLPRAQPGQLFLPNLPGPKPQDYRFTTKTDSFFIFNVAEDIPDRQHAFFIYAVDNLGKPDATPARFIFNSQDRFPPIPIFDECRCVGTVYALNPLGGVTPFSDTTYVTDTDSRSNPTPRDTCAATSKIDIRWHGQPQIPQTVVTGYRYKLDEPQLVAVGPEVTGVTYNSGIPPDTVAPAPGIKIFLLRVVDQANGSRDSTRRFQLNYAPDTWWSGPDLTSPSLQGPPGRRYYPVTPGQPIGPIVGSLLGPDSVNVFPALRPERRTFFEVWKDTIYARQDGDTVHINAWVILHGGGFDRDSKYQVRVSDLARQLCDPDPTCDAFPGGPVLTPSPFANGSPIGFRSIVTMSLTLAGLPSRTALTGLYPIFDPNDVFNLPRIAGYHPVFQAGRAFAVIQAEDSDGERDRRVQDGRDLVLRVEAGTATPEEQALRSKVLTFYVDKAPYFQTGHPEFRPRTTVVDTFKTNLWDLKLVAADEDPYRSGTAPGGPSSVETLRRHIQIHGKDAQGRDITYIDPVDYVNQQNITVLVPAVLAGGPCTVEVELCDCAQCEEFPGTGRCVTLQIPVYYQRSAPAEPAFSTTRPGSDEIHP